MAGHSKFKNIQYRKGAQDKKRAKLFAKISKEITVAAKLGLPDPNANPRLRSAISLARSQNMPKDNIERAIKKSDASDKTNYNSLVYEGFGPEKIAIIVEALTDNKNRTVAEIRHLITKYGGNLGENGSVSWMFDKKGQIVISKVGQNEDNLFEDSINAGAEDFDSDEDSFIVKTDPIEMMSIRTALEGNGYSIDSAKVEMLPKNLHKIEKNQSEKAMVLLDAIEDHEDIKSVYTNLDFED